MALAAFNPILLSFLGRFTSFLPECYVAFNSQPLKGVRICDNLGLPATATRSSGFVPNMHPNKKRSVQTDSSSTIETPPPPRKKTKHCRNDQAESLGQRLDTDVHYLTPNGESWYLLKRKWMPATNFEEEWNRHPSQRQELTIFGKKVYENRWSQSWGVSYAYSGSNSVARPLSEGSPLLHHLLETANKLTQDLTSCTAPYNGCLQNWYQPEHTIGMHSDDERALRRDCPIFSLSWGGTRRFLFRPRHDKNRKLELYLKSGDLLVMGGTCQQTHYHEVPKLRKTMDRPTSNRINWTIRAFHEGL